MENPPVQPPMHVSHKPFFRLICVAIGILVGLSIAYIYFSKTTPPESTQAKKVVDPTASWTTFTNPKSSYSFKYPKDFIQFNPFAGTPSANLAHDEFPATSGDYIVSVFIYTPGNKPAIEFNAKTTREETIPIDGKSVSKKTGIEIIGNTGTLIHVGPIRSNSMEYLITFSSGSKKAPAQALQTFSSVLSTFTFTPTLSLTDQELLKTTVAVKYNELFKKTPDQLVITIDTDIPTMYSTQYARGNVAEKDTGGGAKWIGVKTEAGWVIPHIGQAPPACKDVEKYKFPKEITGCL